MLNRNNLLETVLMYIYGLRSYMSGSPPFCHVALQIIRNLPMFLFESPKSFFLTIVNSIFSKITTVPGHYSTHLALRIRKSFCTRVQLKFSRVGTKNSYLKETSIIFESISSANPPMNFIEEKLVN